MRRFLLIAGVTLSLAISSADAQDTPALQAVKALQSATRAGLTLRDYQPRVVDAKILVDRHLSEEPSSERRQAVARAMDFHIAAAAAWSERVRRYGSLKVSNYPVIQTCPLAQEFATKYADASDSPLRGRIGGTVNLEVAVKLFWRCASDSIAEAEGRP